QVGTLARRPARGGGMSESSTLSVPAGFPAEALTLLVAKGRLKGSLTPDDVIAVLEKVELTPELIDEVRTRLRSEGVIFDESGDNITDDDLTDERLVAPPPKPVVAPVAKPEPKTNNAAVVGRGTQAPRDDRASAAPADLVRVYLEEIGRLSMLACRQEVSLAQRTQA